MKNNLQSLANGASALQLINSVYISSRIMNSKVPVYKGIWELIFIAQMCVLLLMLG